MHVFYSVFSIRCKICKICRSLALRQEISVLMIGVLERFHAFHCLIWSWGSHLFRNDSKKTIPWRTVNTTVKTENTMEKLLQVNPLWANAKLQTQVGLNAATTQNKIFNRQYTVRLKKTGLPSSKCYNFSSFLLLSIIFT